MNWIPNHTTLHGDHIVLEPLQPYHFDELIMLARDHRIWTHIPIDMSDDGKCRTVMHQAIELRKGGTEFPFAICHNESGKLIGSTRLMNIVPQHRKLEIGWTWLHPDHWATIVNPECKLLLLKFCFEQLAAIRVQLKTDENNIRSRKAIIKIGAQFEGILRNDWIRDNGTFRNSAYFSIIDDEWPEAKGKLERRLKELAN
jgi:RimJ/RimL family protein N-acetyltransferase